MWSNTPAHISRTNTPHTVNTPNHPPTHTHSHNTAHSTPQHSLFVSHHNVKRAARATADHTVTSLSLAGLADGLSSAAVAACVTQLSLSLTTPSSLPC